MCEPPATTISGDVGADYPALLAAWMGETIPLLEAAASAKTLPDLLERPDVQEVIRSELLAHYQAIAVAKVRHDYAFRKPWIQRFIRILEQSLQKPRQIFPAQIAPTPNGKKRPKLVSLEVAHPAGVVTLRPDQVVSARFWGIWFDFEKESLEIPYLDLLITRAVHRFVLDIRYLPILQDSPHMRSLLDPDPDTKEPVVGIEDVLFERLLIDVLNESAPLAAVSELVGDVPDCAPLVVTCTGKKPDVVFRLRASLALRPTTQEQQPHPSSIPLLSPWELSTSALQPVSRPELSAVPWNEFWSSVGGPWHEPGPLAQHLHTLFVQALSTPPDHPLGPMWLLPPPLRQFIRAFARIESDGSPKPAQQQQAPAEHAVQTWRIQREALHKRIPTAPHPANTDDLDLVATLVGEVIRELEASMFNGTLAKLVERPDIQAILGPQLAARYKIIASQNLKHDLVFRRNWIDRFLAVLQDSLRAPIKFFPADPITLSWTAGTSKPPSIIASDHGTLTTLRWDQVLSARHWGIWFEFYDGDLEEFYVALLATTSCALLASHVQSLWSIEATFLSGYSNLDIQPRWGTDKRGYLFERLMLDVLNECERIARPAPLAEDLLERTDLRVAYPEVVRNDGSRVQVSLCSDPYIHDSKMYAGLVPEEFILLSPLELARSAVHPPGSPLFEQFDWSALWRSLGGTWRDVHALAQELHDQFVAAMYAPLKHPLGPMWLLPPPIRQFIRTYTLHQAVVTTNRVRERLQTSQRRIGSVDKYTTPYWLAKFAQDTSQEPTPQTIVPSQPAQLQINPVNLSTLNQ